jgi:hypothetical protein
MRHFSTTLDYASIKDKVVLSFHKFIYIFIRNGVWTYRVEHCRTQTVNDYAQRMYYEYYKNISLSECILKKSTQPCSSKKLIKK